MVFLVDLSLEVRLNFLEKRLLFLRRDEVLDQRHRLEDLLHRVFAPVRAEEKRRLKFFETNFEFETNGGNS